MLQTGQRWKVHLFLLSHSKILEILPLPTPSVPSTLGLNDELSAQCTGVQCYRWQQKASTLKQLPSQRATSYRGHSDLDITVMHRRLLWQDVAFQLVLRSTVPRALFILSKDKVCHAANRCKQTLSPDWRCLEVSLFEPQGLGTLKEQSWKVNCPEPTNWQNTLSNSTENNILYLAFCLECNTASLAVVTDLHETAVALGIIEKTTL